MKGYRKISEGSIFCSKIGIAAESNYAFDDDVKSRIHSPILGEVEKSGCEEFYIVVYKKVTK